MGDGADDAIDQADFWDGQPEPWEDPDWDDDHYSYTAKRKSLNLPLVREMDDDHIWNSIRMYLRWAPAPWDLNRFPQERVHFLFREGMKRGFWGGINWKAKRDV